MHEQTEKTCLNCDNVLVGRLDKKFCSADCRNEYNNRRYREEQQAVIQINKILKNNRKILQQLNPTGSQMDVSPELLTKSGFNFNYFTNVEHDDSGKQFNYCYDQGYCLDPESQRYHLTTKEM